MAENKKKKLPKSLRKFIRKEKARIRREVLNMEEQKKKIQQLYENIKKTNPNWLKSQFFITIKV
ncbi:MAG: hypothetical protein COU42_00405 [Candidatus Nealsonbacteria bacterium CG10_big_fil_rev_8_21_14_0_10_36_24]|nr:MAG: hypothetical protein COU42_00405 [Candidatus Nealsonbacteria bacterium CG10_big_fil_rev_8_21_14_0_10_36_24]